MVIIIKRSPANKQAPDIIDKLISTDAVAYQRGRNFLDDSMSKKIYRVQVPYRGWIQIGCIVEINDSAYGEIIKCKVISHSLSVAGTIISNLTIEALP